MGIFRRKQVAPEPPAIDPFTHTFRLTMYRTTNGTINGLYADRLVVGGDGYTLYDDGSHFRALKEHLGEGVHTGHFESDGMMSVYVNARVVK